MGQSFPRDPKLDRAAKLLAEIGAQAARDLCPPESFALPLQPPLSTGPALARRVSNAATDLLDFSTRWLRAGGSELARAQAEERQAVLRRFELSASPLRSSGVSLDVLSLAMAGSLRPPISELASATQSDDQRPSPTPFGDAPTAAQAAAGPGATPSKNSLGSPPSEALLTAWLRYLEAIRSQQELMQGLQSASMDAFLTSLRRLPQRQLTISGCSLRSIHDLWIKGSEVVYGRLLRSKAFPSSIGELVNAASALKLEHDRAVPEPAQVIQDTAREAAAASGLPTGQDPSSASDKQGASPHPQHGSRRAETKSPLAEPFPDDPLDRGLSTHIELRAIKQKITKVLHALNKKSNIRVGWHPREVALQMGRVTLYRYLSPRGRPQRKSLLIVYALVNRPYMIDLEKDRSLIRGFLEAGLDVYLVDWGYPGHQDCDLGIEDYVLDYLDRCVDRVLRDSGCAKVNLLGICQGGVLALCYSALRPEKIGTLVTMVTPTDFSARSSLLAKLVRKIDVDQLVAAFGNVPGDLLSAMFVSLSPHRLGSQKYLRLLDLLDDEAAWSNFLRMEQWIFDSPDQAGKAFRQFVGEFIQKNGLIRGKIHIGGERVDLGHIEVPVLNIYAIQDHLVPAVCAKALGRYVGSRDYTEYAFPGGHIGVYVSRKAQLEIPPRIAAWLQTR